MVSRHAYPGRLLRYFTVVTGLVVFLCMMTVKHPEVLAANGPKYGGTLTVGVDLEFRGFDPLRAAYLQFGDRCATSAIEERLFDMDEKGEPVPELALAAIPSQDGNSWTIELRQGVSFHDGTPFNADAVVEHWQRMLDPKHNFSGARFIEPIQAVTRIDDHTVRFTLKHPWAAFMAMLSSTQWTGAYIPSPKAIRANTQNKAPVGTGPFIFNEWLANDRLVVVKNPNYWRKGIPYLDGIIFRPVPDMQNRFSGLLSGANDVILADRATQIIKARSDKSLKVYSADASGPYTFIINTASPPLDDVRVRRALAHAWNQDLYLKSIDSGLLSVAKEPFGGTQPCGDCGYRDYDPALAKKLLAEYGKPVTLELLGNDTPQSREEGEIMRRLFKEVGITLKVTPLAEAALVKRVMDGDYQISGWRLMDLRDMGPYLNTCLHSKGRLNFSHYLNPAMDELLNTQQLSTDEKTRQRALCEVATLINEDVVYLYGGGRRFYVLAKAGIKGITRVDQGVIRLGEAWVNGNGAGEKKQKTQKPKKKARR